MARYKLTAVVTHKSIKKPIVHEFYFHGQTKDDALDKIDTHSRYVNDLREHGKTSFKSKDGVQHKWRFELVSEEKLT